MKVETLSIILPIKVTFYKNDFDSDQEWDDFKKEMLTDKEEALETFQDNIVDADLRVRDYIEQMRVEISEVNEDEEEDEEED